MTDFDLTAYEQWPSVEDRPLLSPSELVAKLQGDGLLVEDVVEAEQWIRTVGYFHLKGYLSALKTKSGSFQHHPNFRDAITLLVAERDLRGVLLAQLGKFELAFKAAIVAEVGAGAGDGYLDQSNFDPEAYDDWRYLLGKVLTRLLAGNDLIEDKFPFIAAYMAKHPQHKLPLWRLIECMSFGETVALYRFLSLPHRVAIASKFANPKELDGKLNDRQFLDCLEVLRQFRNLAAHFHVFFDKSFDFPRNASDWRHTELEGSIYFCDAVRVQHTYGVIAMLMFFEPAYQPVARTWRREVFDCLSAFSNRYSKVLGRPGDWQDRPYWLHGDDDAPTSDDPSSHPPQSPRGGGGRTGKGKSTKRAFVTDATKARRDVTAFRRSEVAKQKRSKRQGNA